MSISNINNVELFNHVNNGVMVLDAECGLLFWNDWLYLHTGVRSEDVVGKLLTDIFPDINAKKLTRKMNQAKLMSAPSYYKGANDKFLIPIEQKSLTEQHYEFMQQDVTVSYLADNDCYLVTIYDCTPYLEIEQKLLETNKKNIELADINKKHSATKSEFLAHTSHELRTPLNSILGFMELMKTTRLTSEQRDYLNVMLDSSNSMLDIVNSVMSISEIEKGVLEYKPSECNFINIVKSSAELFYAKALEKSISLICFIDPKIPSSLYADGSKIRQILLNFISNAIKFTPEFGAIRVKAELTKLENGFADIKLSVKDSGVGMNDDFIKKIFMPYEREQSEEYFEGSGVGLYICSKFAGLMHSVINVDSVNGEGSEFSFVFRSKVLNGSTFSEVVNINGSRLGILLHDENSFLAETIKSYIHSFGVEFVEYSTVEEVIHDVENGLNTPDVLIVTECDELCIEENVISRLNNVPIVCLTNKLCSTYADSSHGEKLIKYRGILDPKSFMLAIKDAIQGRVVTGAEREKRVLVMEDNYNNQELMKVIFGKLGAIVDVASNGETGLLYFKQHKYDLVLIDINMPIKNGIETIKAIREYIAKHPAEFPEIYALTAHALKEKQEEYIDIGFDGYLVKPININILKQLLNGSEEVGELGIEHSEKDENIIEYIRQSMYDNADIEWDDVERLLDIFFKSIYSDINEVKAALEVGNTKVVSTKGHYVKGQFLSFRLFNLADMISDIEKFHIPLEKHKALELVEELNVKVKYIQESFENYRYNQ